MATEITYITATNGFFDGAGSAEDLVTIDERATIDAYADECRAGLALAYPDADITVEISSNLLENKLTAYENGEPMDNAEFHVGAQLQAVWDNGTFWVERAA